MRLRRGQATIEFAIILPVIISLVIGVAYLGARITADVNMTNAAQAGAQAAADTLDKIDAALSCAPPASTACVTSAMTLIKQMIDAGLPCPGVRCQSAVHALANDSLAAALHICFAITPGCNLAGSIKVAALINNAMLCPPASCLVDAETFAEGAMEAGLGCDGQYDRCPPPLAPTAACPAGSTCRPSCLPATGCTKYASVEVIGDVAAKSLACAAIRRSLRLDYSTVTCDHAAGDDPWIDTEPAFPGGTGYDLGRIPTTCIPTGAVPAELLATDCAPGPGPAYTMIELRVTVHSADPAVVAGATAVPASQFSIAG